MLLQGGFLTRAEARRLSPVTLAFLGDAVYALYVRERLVKTGGGKVADFQRASSKILSATAQSEFLNNKIIISNIIIFYNTFIKFFCL